MKYYVPDLCILLKSKEQKHTFIEYLHIFLNTLSPCWRTHSRSHSYSYSRSAWAVSTESIHIYIFKLNVCAHVEFIRFQWNRARPIQINCSLIHFLFNSKFDLLFYLIKFAILIALFNLSTTAELSWVSWFFSIETKCVDFPLKPWADELICVIKCLNHILIQYRFKGILWISQSWGEFKLNWMYVSAPLFDSVTFEILGECQRYIIHLRRHISSFLLLETLCSLLFFKSFSF